jgi:general secretion pathway protein K
VAVMESIHDWLDSDNQPEMYGAEDDYYLGQSPAYRAGNRAMVSVSELRAVANVSPELYRALAPWVTVWPAEGGPLNIHTAPAQVLRSLNVDDDLTPLDPALAEALVSQREETPFADIDDFMARLNISGEGTAIDGLRSVLGESSAWFLMSAVVEVADRSAHLYSVLHRTSGQVEVEARSSGEL